MYSENMTLLGVLKGNKERSKSELYYLLKGHGLKTRIQKIKMMFLGACREEDDENASKLFPLLMKAIQDDVSMSGYADDCFDSLLWIPEGGCFLEEVYSERLEMIMNIYEEIPVCKPSGVKYQAFKDESKMIEFKAPALLKTRGLIIEEVTHCWREIDDKKKVRKAFKFLNDILSRETEELMEFPEKEKEMRLKSFEKAISNSFFFNERILDAILRWSKNFDEKPENREVLEILKKALVFNQEPEEFFWNVKLLKILYNYPDEVLDVIRKNLKKISSVVIQAKEIEDISMLSVRGTVKIRYTENFGLVVSIKWSRENETEDFYSQNIKKLERIIEGSKNKYLDREIILEVERGDSKKEIVKTF